MSSWRELVAAALVFALSASGCGDSRDAAPTAEPEPKPRPAPRVTEPVDPPQAAEDDHADAGQHSDAGPLPMPLPPGKPLLLEFTRNHCLPCEIMAPWMKELRAKHAAQVKIIEINIDRAENKQLARYFKARSIPTQVYVDKSGRQVSRHVGLATKPQMERTMKRHGFLEASNDERK
jgi:thioredoxin 1